MRSARPPARRGPVARRPCRSLSLALTCLAASVLALASPAAAQTGTEDAGTFRISIGGHPVGTEEFVIRQSGTGASTEIVANGRVRLDLSTGSLELTPRLRTSGFQANPVSYEVTVGGDAPRRITGTIGRGRFSARIVTPSGEQMREYVATAGAVVLDDAVAHHYYFLARRIRNGRVPILVPRENRQVMASVADRGEENVSIDGTSVRLFHLVVTPDDGNEQHVWVDALNRVIRVEIPASDYLAERTEIPR